MSAVLLNVLDNLQDYRHRAIYRSMLGSRLVQFLLSL